MSALIKICRTLGAISLLMPSALAENQHEWFPCWESRKGSTFGGNHLRTDNFGNVYTIGSDKINDHYRMVLLKWDRYGDPLWERHFRPSGSVQTQAFHLDMDRKRNIVVVGTTKFDDEDSDVTVASWTENGDCRWSASFGKGKLDMSPYGMGIDGRGNTYVTGNVRILDVAARVEFFWAVFKISRNGDIVWSKISAARGEASGIAVDRNGDCYVGGCYTSFASNFCIQSMVTKYDTKGIVQWDSTHFPGSIDAITINKRKSLVVLGEVNTLFDTSRIMLKLNSTDSERTWTTKVPGIRVDSLLQPIARRGNSIYFSGEVDYVGNWVTSRYSEKDGSLLWSRQTDEPTRNAFQRDVKVDEQHNVYVFGRGFRENKAVIFIYNKHGRLVFKDEYSFANSAVVYEGAVSCDGDFVFSVHVQITDRDDRGVDRVISYEVAVVKYKAKGSLKKGECKLQEQLHD